MLGLSEIENTYSVTGNKSKRDEALQNLVDALNEKQPNKWDLVKSPQKLGTDEDVIRVAFIYQPAKVEPVGESIIFDDSAFTRTARQPLAQEFNTIGNDEDDVSLDRLTARFAHNFGNGLTIALSLIHI